MRLRWLVVFVLIAVVVPSRAAVPAIVLVLVAAGASRWSVRRVARGLEVRCEVPRWASHGQRLEALAVVRNASRVPAPWLELDVPCGLGLGRTTPHREALPVSPGERVVRRVPLLATARGRHHVGPPRLRVGDVLGIAATTLAPTTPEEVVVFPRIVPLARLGLPASSPFVTLPAHRSVLVDPTSVVGTRDYEPGDALSSIHWPATARTGTLAVKQYERAEARETLLCLDLSPAAYPRPARPAAELAITVAASMAHHTVVEERLPAGLVTAGTEPGQRASHLPARDGLADLRRLLEILALVQPGTGPPLGSLLSLLDTGLPAGTTVVAVTGQVDDDARVALLRLARQGLAVAVVLVGAAAPHAAGVPGVPIFRVADESSLPVLAS